MHTQYVALLRGINVGGNTKVSMAVLKQVFEKLGFSDVSTYINSGNVIFSSDRNDTATIVADIEEAILAAFGFRVPVVVRSQQQLEEVLANVPGEWENNTEQKTDIIFLWDEVDSPESRDALAPVEGVDTLVYLPGTLLWNLKREHYAKSAMQNFIGTNIYKKMTARNVNTLRKMVDLLQRA